ncbi:hypothetical protein MHT86_02990 [Corynebacterium mastitidis]|uniref:hypothetical protein n=1 Tax=Corynebacterium mastitidis TaxID=161890 RepID=UPI001F12FB2B|nr:hypothetical protein [Corynebacterium mastitidis]MCH6196462.1 hypothetical protein [Corynebacterium mastitidis]
MSNIRSVKNVSTRGDDAVRSTSRPWRALPLVLAAGLGIAACSSDPAEPEASIAETTQTAQAVSEETSAAATTHSPTKADKEAEALKQVAATYASLAPAELFEKFDSCTPNGLEGSHECSGPGIGQFQFYDSSAKATSSTQQLTQLRSSHVMRDTGDIVVGWSTLGTSAVITVVDNKEGLVMQQLVSSDKVDPEKRIVELGLADAEEALTESAAPTSAEATDSAEG